MIDDPKWIGATVAGIVGAMLYYGAFLRNEKRRPKTFEGYICGRCRQGFSESELRPIWQFPTVPLRLLGWNHEREMDVCYCERCRRILNAFMALGVVLGVPVMFTLVYLAAQLF